MRIITTGAKEILFNRLQCLRDVNLVAASNIDLLTGHREECCEFMKWSNLENVEWNNGEEVQW